MVVLYFIIINNNRKSTTNYFIVNDCDCLLYTSQQVLAIFEQPQYTLDPEAVRQSLCLALDDVQDPGNLGTIIRLADWLSLIHI